MLLQYGFDCHVAVITGFTMVLLSTGYEVLMLAPYIKFANDFFYAYVLFSGQQWHLV